MQQFKAAVGQNQQQLDRTSQPGPEPALSVPPGLHPAAAGGGTDWVAVPQEHDALPGTTKESLSYDSVPPTLRADAQQGHRLAAHAR